MAELSVPGRLWNYVPDWIVQNDAHFRFFIAQNPSTAFWEKVRFYTDRAPGLYHSAALVFVLLTLKLCWQGLKTLRGFLDSFVKSCFIFASFAFLLLISDGFSITIKRIFGRLKPYVLVYTPNEAQPLSFPSNHAFNMSFLFAFAYYWMSPEERKKERLVLWGLGLATLFVGYSRVVLGQHYPLDVFAGWGLGVFFAYVCAGLFKKAELALKTRFRKRA